MRLLGRVFTTYILIAAAGANAYASNCDNATYRRLNPYKCATRGNTGLIIGAAGAIGAGAAIFALSASGGGGGSGGGTSATGTTMPTVQTYDMRGNDVTAAGLASAISDKNYNRNINQYNDIRLAYSIARGYTGAGSTIAILDGGANSWHGANVAATAAPVAPGANIVEYQVTNASYEFLPYKQIGEIIGRATDADIFNASWSVEMRATDIRSRAQLERLTDPAFISQISAAADRGAIFVWAAGNDGASQSSALSAIPRVVPELQGHFINVVAWDSATGRLADYSNACGVTSQYCITAPGTEIVTDTSVATGTSFAAPIVSAAVATLREAFPYMSATQITTLLFETARDLGAPGVDEIYGHGMLDMERATRPVGATLVPIGDEMMAPLQNARVSAQIAHNIKSADIKFAYFDKYGRPFQASLHEHISAKNPSKALERLRGTKQLKMNFGALEMGFRSNDFILGEGLLKAQRNHTIGFIGLNGEIPVGKTTIHAIANIGQSRPTAMPESMISKFSSVYTAHVSVTANRGDWHFGIAAPDAILRGNMHLRTPTGRGNTGDIIFTDQTARISGRPTLEYTIGYKFMSATFVDNPYGTDEIFFMAKSTIAF